MSNDKGSGLHERGWHTRGVRVRLTRASTVHFHAYVQVSRNDKQWRNWFDKEAPEDEIIPDGYNTSLDVFRRLLLVRCWAPDRTLAQARKYIADSLGDKYAEGVILDMEKMWEESDNRQPLVGLLSMGSDPTPSIEKLAKKLKIGEL